MGLKKIITLESELDDKLKEELKEMFKSELREMASEVIQDLMDRVEKLEDWRLDIKNGWVRINE